MNILFKSLRSSMLLATAALFSLVLGGCGGGSGTAGSSLSLGITDAPVDGVTSVVIEFTEVQVHSTTGSTLDFLLPTPQQMDLMQLTSGKSTLLLDHQSLTAGQYDWIRLLGDETHSYVMTSTGSQMPLQIPSFAQTGLKLIHPFTLTANGVASFVIDFNLRQSLHIANSAYILRPTLRIVDATTTGGITGTVDATLINAQGCTDVNGGAVYVYSGAGVTPVDVNTTLTTVQPLTTASVTLINGVWQYTAAYLNPGAYTAAFTCQSTSDSPDTTDNIVFQDAADVTVVSGQNATHNFP